MTEPVKLKPTEILESLETQLRQPDTDRQFLASQLRVLAGVVAIEDDIEDAMTQAALAGMYYTMDRLRRIWAKGAEPEPLEEMIQRYAEVELSRYAKDEEVVRDSIERFRSENMMASAAQVVGADGLKYTAFYSPINQTTIDGRRVMKYEAMSATSESVVPFTEILRRSHEFKQTRG